jgi:outer membrane protein assembly factor BamB
MIRSRAFLLAGVLVLGIVASGCEWTMFGYDTANTHQSPDTTIGGTDVSGLVEDFVGNTGGPSNGTPVEANGVVYVVSQISSSSLTEALEAFDANGYTNCGGTPTTCSPLWTAGLGAATGYSSPAVANGVVYAGAANNLEAFDAAGMTNCGGTPKVCSPLWTASVGPIGASSPIVSNGVVYVGSNDGNLYAFDAAGSTNCSGTPTVCSPLWSGATGGSVETTPAVSNGVVYVGSHDDDIYAFDATGSTNCSGTPTVCSPLWTGATGGAIDSSPAVANGTLYIGSDDGNLYAFDATGTTNCSGTPTTCSPLWTAATGDAVYSSPAVANGVVYVGVEGPSGGALDAFDASGVENCTGTPKTCSPLWTGPTPLGIESSPAVANGIVYVGESQLYAFDAAGVTNCSGTVCSPLRVVPESTGFGNSGPSVANGKLYIGSYNSGFMALDLLQTQVLVPSNEATLSGWATLDASASGGADVTGVQFVLNGGSISEQVVGTGTAVLTPYGWIVQWHTTTVPNGTYSLQSEATEEAPGSSPTTVSSPPIQVTVSN